MTKKIFSIILVFAMLFTIVPATTTAKATLKSRVLAKTSGKSGKFSIGILNLKTGESLYINTGRVRAASVIKVFVMMSAFRKIKEGGLKLNKVIKLRNRTIERVGGTGILQGKPTGYKITVAKLIEYMIMYSDNRAANIVTDLLGFKYINDTIKKYKYSADTQLGYYFCLTPVPAGKSNTLTVKDLNLLFKRLYTKTCISPVYDNQMIQIMKKTINKTKICAFLPKGTVVAHKTGSITNIESDAGIVFSKGGDFAISVLAQAPNGGATITTIANIAKTAYDYFNGK